MSPEQAKGSAHTADRRSDVYSLGVILFELLTGERPFRGNIRMLVHQVINDEPPSPRRLNGAVPRDLETICLKCLEKEPAKRYASARTMADDLRNYVAGAPIAARPVTVVARSWRWCKRRPVVAGLVGALLATLTIGLLMTSWLWSRAEHAADEARRQAYVSDMNSACQAIQENNFVRVEQLLDRQKPNRKQSDFLGFEWYFLRRMCNAAKADRTIGLAYPCAGVKFSPNDDNLAVGLANRSAAIVSLHEESEPYVFGPADDMWHPKPGMAFLDSGDVLAYSFGEGIWLRDAVPDAAPDRRILSGDISDLSVSADGKYIATRSFDQTVQILTTDQFELVTSFKQEGGQISTPIAWSPTDRIVACGFTDEQIHVWDAKSGRQLAALPAGKGGPALAFSSDGSLLATGAYQSTVQVWDWQSQRLLHTLAGHTDHVYGLAFSPDGRLLATGSRDNTVILWDLPAFKPKRILRGHSAAVTGLSFSRGSQLLASVSSDGTLRLWDLGRPHAPELIRIAPALGVTDLDLASDSQTLAAICGRDRFVFPEDPYGGGTQEVRFWRIDSGETLPSLKVGRNVFSLAFGAQGLLATGGEDGRIDLWNWRSQTLNATLPGHSGLVRALAFSRDGSMLASGSDDGRARLWDVAAQKEIRTPFAHDGRVRAVSFSHDELTLATGGDDHLVKLWSIKPPSLKKALPGHASAILSVAFSPDDRQLASSSWDKTIKVWRPFEKGSTPFKGHSMWVSSVRFSHDGRTLFTTSGDRKVKIWDVDLAQERFTMGGHSDGVTCMAIAPDENVIAPGGRDGTIRLWRVATGAELTWGEPPIAPDALGAGLPTPPKRPLGAGLPTPPKRPTVGLLFEF